MVKPSSKKNNKFIQHIKNSFSGLVQCENLNLTESYRLGLKKVRVRTGDYPIQINIGPQGKTLHIYPERPINHSKKGFDDTLLKRVGDIDIHYVIHGSHDPGG